MRISIIGIRCRTIVAVLLAAFILFLTSCSSTNTANTLLSAKVAHLPQAYKVVTQNDLHYGPLPGENLDLCFPTNASTLRPGVILIHGGGWTGGGKSTNDSFCSSLASQGFVAATINYRLTPGYTWPAQLVDAQLAVRWLRAKANSIHLNPQRLCAYGTSAGAHLSIFLGTLATIHPGDEAGLFANESPEVSCVVDEFGPTDLTRLLSTPYQQSIVLPLMHNLTLQNDPALYRDASPLFDVTPQSAAMLIIQGTEDTIVPPAQSLALQQSLRQAHVPAQYISYKGGHGFTGLNQRQRDAIQAQVITFLVAQEHP